MAELVDALVLGASEILVWVRVPLPAPLRLRILRDFQTQFCYIERLGSMRITSAIRAADASLALVSKWA